MQSLISNFLIKKLILKGRVVRMIYYNILILIYMSNRKNLLIMKFRRNSLKRSKNMISRDISNRKNNFILKLVVLKINLWDLRTHLWIQKVNYGSWELIWKTKWLKILKNMNSQTIKNNQMILKSDLRCLWKISRRSIINWSNKILYWLRIKFICRRFVRSCSINRMNTKRNCRKWQNNSMILSNCFVKFLRIKDWILLK